MPAREITKEEVQQKLREGAQIVNVLDPDNYGLGMIQGSKKIPYAEISMRLTELDKSKEVITYCSGYSCTASKDAADFLEKKGFKACAYRGGIAEWKAAGLPMEEARVEKAA